MVHPAPPGRRAGRRGLTVALIVTGVLVLGGGVAAAVTLLGGDDPDEAIADKPGQAPQPANDAGDSPAIDEATQTTEEPAPAGLLADGPDDQFTDDIRSVLLDFHRAIVNNNYRTAWDLLSERKRAKFTRDEGYDGWVEAQSSLAPSLSPDGLEVSVQDVDRVTGVARVALSGMAWSARNARCSEWAGVSWVKFENDAWRYDPGYATTPQREREWKARFSELLGGSC